LFYHKLPFLIIPMAIGFLSVFNKQVLYKFLYLFIILIFVTALVVLLNYIFHLEAFNKALLQGIPIPAPHGHVRFSLMMVFAGMTSIYFLFSKKIILHRYDCFFFAFAALFLFVVVHVLSVRIGILAFYVALLFMLFYQTYASGKYYFFIASLLVLLAIPVLSYKIIPSFKNRIDYMIYDLEQMKQGNIGYNSDSRRMISLKVGWEMAMDNLWLGVGAGNLEQAVEEYYQSKFPEVDTHNRKLPHNQFLSVFVELGLIGLLFLLAAIFLPLFYADTYKNSVFISLWLIVFVSMWVDSTLETQIGITFYTLFSSLLLKFEKLPDA
jgi:O-antigen ligase